jgi:pimeloyl-ACP methyl ester carboxylesterase
MYRRAIGPLEAILSGLVLLVVVVVGTGVTYQSIATYLDRREYAPPGQLVDVGGYHMHIYCMGQGTPAVILDALGDGTSSNWGWVQPEIAKTNLTCSYDRAGLGWSESGPEPRTALQSAKELFNLLRNAGIPEPYILVGHSFGANVVRLFAQQYPRQTAGMVLVDPGLLLRDPRMPETFQAQSASDEQFMAAAPFLAYAGLFRLLGQRIDPGAGLPGRQRAEVNAEYASTQHWLALSAQSRAMPATSLQVIQAGVPSNLPLIVLSADTPSDESRKTWTEINTKLAGQSIYGMHQIVPGATHAGLVNQQAPAQVVSEAIRQVLAMVHNLQAVK